MNRTIDRLKLIFLAAFAILMPATAGLSAQTTLGWPSNSGQNPAAAPAQSAPSALDNYLQQQAYPQQLWP